MKYQLSILIPSRNEMFLKNTVEDILKNKRGATEILVGLDGQWSEPPLVDHPDVTIVYYNSSIGQRGITNQLCRLSKAKYVMKVDAHCAFDEGFDVKLMKDMQDDMTMIPALYNLHAFDWICKCGHRKYQGPTTPCEKCGKDMKREMIWKPRLSRRSEFYRFDKTLHFQYWSDLKKRYKPEDRIVETLSAQGSCFMLTREKYWELDICDEEHGSWGQQGTEVACKTWLSGGRLVTNRNTWYSHMFRTQGMDFGFPYPQSGRQVEHARQYSRKLFLEGKWPKAKHDLKWLLDKFYPVPDWHDEVKRGIIYYTDNQLNMYLASKCRKQIAKAKLPIVSASLKPLDFGKNIVVKLERGYEAYFRQILAALENSTSDVIFFTEHDWLYHGSHFDFTPPKKDVFYYNDNWYRVRASDGFAVTYDTHTLPGLVAYRDILIDYYRNIVDYLEKHGFTSENARHVGFEPGTHGRVDFTRKYKVEGFKSRRPNLDIRHGNNLTASKWTQDDFRSPRNCRGWKECTLKEIPGWSAKSNDFNEFLKQI